MHASEIVSAAFAGRPAGWALWGLAALLLWLLPAGEASTKSFHQTEDGCNCLRNCEIFDMGDCSDDSLKNKEVFEAGFDKVPNSDGDLCKALQAMAYCGARQTGVDIGQDEIVLCQGIAKQIGCNVNCGGAVRRGQGVLLVSAVAALAVIGLAAA